MKYRLWGDGTRLLRLLSRLLGLGYVDEDSLYLAVSVGGSSRSARIWCLPRVFIDAVGFKPTYVVEIPCSILPMECSRLIELLVHELAHISQSGGLTPHIPRFYHRLKTLMDRVESLDSRDRSRLCSLARSPPC